MILLYGHLAFFVIFSIPEKQRRAESHLHPSTVAKGTDATRPTSAAAAEPVARVSDTSQTKPVAAADEEAGAAEPMERTSLLIKAKRKSLHDMRHLRSIKTAEEVYKNSFPCSLVFDYF